MLAYAFMILFLACFLAIAVHGAFLWIAVAAGAFLIGAAVMGFFWTLTGCIDPFRFTTRR